MNKTEQDAQKARSINFSTYNLFHMIPIYVVQGMIKKMKEQIVSDIIGGRIDNIINGK